MGRLPWPLHGWAFHHSTRYRRWAMRRAFRELHASFNRLKVSFATATDGAVAMRDALDNGKPRYDAGANRSEPLTHRRRAALSRDESVQAQGPDRG